MAFFSTTALGPTSALFRGRQAELTRLMQLCQEEVTAYVVLYGGRQNGKTSLLMRLEAQLASSVHVCRVDFQLIKGAPPERVFAFLAEHIAQTLPLAPDSSQSNDGPSLLHFLSQALLRSEINRLVLLLDEFGALPLATREALANALRSFFHARLVRPPLAKLQIVFSGGIELYNLVITEASSLHNICEEVFLADLDQTDATALIADGLHGLGIADATARAMSDAVYAHVAGHPYLTQRIGGLLDGYHRRGEALSPALIDAAVQQIQRGDPLLRRIRDDLYEQKLEDAARLLLTNPPFFTRLNDDMVRLELIGLAKQEDSRWAPRNHLLAHVFGDMLGVPLLKRVTLACDPVTPSSTASPTGQSTERNSAVYNEANATSPVRLIEPMQHEPTQQSQPNWVPELIRIPAGPFLMGSTDVDPLYSSEKPQHQLELPEYWIGKTPVTNAQFHPFVEGDGYRNPAYWTATGWQWRETDGILKPRYWNDAKWNGDIYPVAGISWFEAIAYCRWLSVQTGQAFRLPSEAEWEKAARGPDGLIWPWGSQWKAGCCNSAEWWQQSKNQTASGSGVFAAVRRWLKTDPPSVNGQTTPVGQFPAGASPYGVLDMSGNVWEWCATVWQKKYPYEVDDEWQRSYLGGDEIRVLRGGSWYNRQEVVRGASRGSYFFPRYRDSRFGLRVARDSLRTDADS